MTTNQSISMKAVVMEKYGEEDAIQIRQMPRPKISENEVLVEVYAAGVIVVPPTIFLPSVSKKLSLTLISSCASIFLMNRSLKNNCRKTSTTVTAVR
ncbi:MAG: hypothetical protein PHR16_03260 [Methylovulum sp.]|nr:hypothetical protein [Methylovulum sp.]